MLAILATACPALQQLQVSGQMTREVLAAFGSSCKRLSSLRIMSGLSTDTIEKLHLIMPQLTHCHLSIPDDWLSQPNRHSFRPVGPCCKSLSSCTTLTHLDIAIGACTLSCSDWSALPPALIELKCALQTFSFDGEQPAAVACLQPLSKLQNLVCHCTRSGKRSPAILVAALRLAPSLQNLILSNVWKRAQQGDGELTWIPMSCQLSTIPDLVSLHSRISAGLKVTYTPNGVHGFQGINISLFDDNYYDTAIQNIENVFSGSEEEEEEQESDVITIDKYVKISKFLAHLPPLPSFTHLTLSVLCLQEPFSWTAAKIPQAFPELTSLVLKFFISNQIESLAALGACTGLQHLTLEFSVLAPALMAPLCQHLTSLKELRLHECRHAPLQLIQTYLCDADRASLQHKLQQQGSEVKVFVKGRYVERR